jgi:hypothetical protein
VRGLAYQFVCPVQSANTPGHDQVLREINQHVSRALLESNTVERLVQGLCAELTGRVLRELELSARATGA